MAFIFTYTAAVLTIVFVVTAAFLFLKGRKDILTRIFILYLISNVLWIGGNALADISRTEELLIIASGIAFIGGTFLVTFFLIFVDTFIDHKIPSLSRLILYFLPSILFTIFSFSEYAVLGTVFPPGEPAQIIPGIQYSLSLIFLFAGLLYGLGRLVHALNRSTAQARLQILYMTIGFAGLFAGQAIFSVILPLSGELRFFNVAPQFSLIFVLAASYAIYRHNLLDIRMALQRGFIYSLLFCFIITFYLAVITLTGFFIQQVTETTILINAGLTTLLGIFTVPYIDRFLRAKTDHFFFKDTYNYAQTLYELTEKINESVLVEDIQTLTEVSLRQLFKANTATVSFVAKDKPGQWKGGPKKSGYSQLNVPIIFDGAVVGEMHLGEKNSGDSYTKQDIVLIKTFAHQIAGAFEKAKLYKEVQQYSKVLEQRVAERTEQIAQLQQHQTRMMLDISHKLQSPLTVVKSELERVRRNMSDKRSFDFFEKTIDEISAFIYDLLHLARLETIPSEHLIKEETNLSELLTELSEYFEVMAQQRGIDFKSQIAEKIYFACDKPKITELLTNLVSNAVKYSKKNASVRYIYLRLAKSERAITLEVIDNGIGIAQKDIPYIFDRFYRTTATESVHGTGLGLAICKMIVQLHGGTIAVAITPKDETIFTVTFPLH